MPTSSQSQILSVVDYHLHKQKQQRHRCDDEQHDQTKSFLKITVAKSKKVRHKVASEPLINEKFNEDENQSPSPPPPSLLIRRRSSGKVSDARSRAKQTFQRPLIYTSRAHHRFCAARGSPSARSSQRQDLLHMPVININEMTLNPNRTAPSGFVASIDHPLSKINVSTASINDPTKGIFFDASRDSFAYRRASIDSEYEDQPNSQYRLRSLKKVSPPASVDENPAIYSDTENNRTVSDEQRVDDDCQSDQQSTLLNENARRLMVLGTIRPSKTFYKNLPQADINHLMDYFRRMKTANQRVTAEELNQELATQHIEYQPKIFFDSTCVTKAQVIHLEKLIEPYADQIRMQRAELIRIDNPVRFMVKSVDNDQPLTIIPREYNDCLISLVGQSDPSRKSQFISDLVPEKLIEDVKSNALDISYFPGGINYDVPREEIDETGQMPMETYQKLKKRLSNRKVWYFSGPPEKKPKGLIAILPVESSIRITHDVLLKAIYERLKSISSEDNYPVEERILSIEFVPLSCILSSNDVSNQFIIGCDSKETKQQLMETPLKLTVNKQSVQIELQSHDEIMQREYEKFIKSEKYQELLKNHDDAKKRLASNKKSA